METSKQFSWRDLPQDIEHEIHGYLRIQEVLDLRCVSKAWRDTINGALRNRAWDLTHCNGIDSDDYTWVTRVADIVVPQRTKIRSLSLVSFTSSFILVGVYVSRILQTADFPYEPKLACYACLCTSRHTAARFVTCQLGFFHALVGI